MLELERNDGCAGFRLARATSREVLFSPEFVTVDAAVLQGYAQNPCVVACY